jgi:hypothetical protein
MRLIIGSSKVLRINPKFPISYLKILTSKVVAGEDENSPSNADGGMTWPKPAFPAYRSCSHVSGAWNELAAAISANRQPDPVGAEKFAKPEERKNRPAGTNKHMQQGSAGAFRHVAPALLLC